MSWRTWRIDLDREQSPCHFFRFARQLTIDLWFVFCAFTYVYVRLLLSGYWPWQCIERVTQCLRLSEKESKSAKDKLSSMALSRPITIELYVSTRKLTKPVSRTKESRFSSRKQLQKRELKFLCPYIETTLKWFYFQNSPYMCQTGYYSLLNDNYNYQCE